uniref:Synaptonemal complex protein 2 n=1 Tax=Rousettus aegyptiacus TaxID=9407 RepID=A0A7J8DL74_ROUAE|nr:synaptonemal complex protein 2 [Rousettus aegyptiacus]
MKWIMLHHLNLDRLKEEIEEMIQTNIPKWPKLQKRQKIRAPTSQTKLLMSSKIFLICRQWEKLINLRCPAS